MFLYNLLKIGDSEITDFKIGTNQVDKVYLGTQLLWKKSTIYGWSVNPSISDPYQAVTYLEDAIGKTPSKMFPTYIIDTDFGVWGVDSDGYPYVLHDSWVDVYRLYTPMIDINKGQTITINNPSIAGKTVQIWFFTIDSEGKRVTHTPDAVALPYTFTSSDNTKFFMSIKYQDDSAITQFNMSYTLNDFSYGDWQNSFFMPKPCMLKNDGSVDYYLDENNYRWINGLGEHNLVVDKLLRSNIDSGGIIRSRGIPDDNVFELAIAPIEQGKSYSVAISDSDGAIVIGFFYTYPTVNASSYNNSRIVVQDAHEYTFTAPITGYMVLRDKTVGSEEIIIQGNVKILSDISDSTYGGNAMVEWPTIYYKFETLEDKGYKQVKYIKSNGTQVIQTDIIPKSTTKVEVDLRFGNNVSGASGDSGKAILGATEYENNAAIAQYRINAQDSTSLKCLTFYNKFTWHQGQSVNYLNNPNNFNDGSTNIKQTLTLNVGMGYWGNQSVDFTSEISSSFRELTIPIALFGTVDSALGGLSPHTIKELEIYNVRMYENNIIIHNLIPTERQSDNVLGLYDTITSKFYTNAGTGTFVKGSYVTENHGWFYCSDVKVDNSFNCWSNYDCYNHITPHFYTPIYNTTISNNKMRSLSGFALTTANGSGTTTGRLELDSALANNTTPDIEWYSGVWSDRVLISALMILIGKSLNNQAIFGNGINTQANKEAYTTGTLNDKGMFYGSFADNASAVKIFGMENFYGCVGQRIAGLVGTNTGYAYKLTYGNIDGSNVDTYNDSGLGYKFVSGQPTATSTLNWIDKMHFGDYGVLPISVSGGANTYWADSFWSGTNYAVIGRNDSNSDYATGSLSIDLTNSFSTASWNISGSLSCKPILRLPNVDTNTLRIHSENIVDYRPNGNSTVEVQLYVKDSSYLPAYNELTGRILLAGSTATSIDDEKIYVLDVDNEWKIMYELEQD